MNWLQKIWSILWLKSAMSCLDVCGCPVWILWRIHVHLMFVGICENYCLFHTHTYHCKMYFWLFGGNNHQVAIDWLSWLDLSPLNSSEFSCSQVLVIRLNANYHFVCHKYWNARQREIFLTVLLEINKFYYLQCRIWITREIVRFLIQQILS